jgi:hypothetical protein
MVRRRSTVRFRNGAPGQLDFSNSYLSADLKIKRLTKRCASLCEPANVPLTSRWYLGYREVLRYLRLPDLVLSDAMPQSSRICPGFVRCPSPLLGERRRHALLAGELTYAGLVEPVRSGWPCRSEADQPAAARRRLFGASEYDRRADRCRAVGMGESAL